MYKIVFEMMHKGVLLDIEIDEVATPLSEPVARRYFQEMILGIEYCELHGLLSYFLLTHLFIVHANDIVHRGKV